MSESKQMQCPACKHPFSFTVGDGQQAITCPHCAKQFMYRKRTASSGQPTVGRRTTGPRQAVAPAAAEPEHTIEGLSGSADSQPAAAPAAHGNFIYREPAIDTASPPGLIRFSKQTGALVVVLALALTGLVLGFMQQSQRSQATNTAAEELQQAEDSVTAARQAVTAKQAELRAAQVEYDKLSLQHSANAQKIRDAQMNPITSYEAQRLQMQIAEQRTKLAALKNRPAGGAAAAVGMGSLDLERLKRSVLIIESGDNGFGTGFYVEGNRILTNFHVIRSSPIVKVKYLLPTPADQPPKYLECTNVKVVAAFPERDIALLTADFPQDAPDPLKLQGSVQVGQPVYVIGNPGAAGAMLTHTVSNGIISGTDRLIEAQKFLQTTAAINPGNSGGPVFNNVGEVIGIVTLKVTGADNLGFVIPGREVQAFVRDADQYAVPADYAAFLEKADPIGSYVRALRDKAMEMVTTQKLDYKISDWGIDKDGTLWVVDISGNRLVAFNPETMEQNGEIPLTGTPHAFAVARNSDIAYLLVDKGETIMRVSLSRKRQLKSYTTKIPCIPFLETLDSSHALAIAMAGMKDKHNGNRIIQVPVLLIINADREYIYPVQHIFPENFEPASITVGARQVTVVGQDTRTRELKICPESIRRLQEYMLLLARIENATNRKDFDRAIQDVVTGKYFARQSAIPMKYFTNELSLYTFHEGPDNSAFLGNAILKGPPPYTFVGTLPSASTYFPNFKDIDEESIGMLDNIYNISPDGKYGASAVAIYDLAEKKILKPLPFPTSRVMFSKTGEDIYIYEPKAQKLHRFPWKKLPDLDIPAAAEKPPEPAAPPAP